MISDVIVVIFFFNRSPQLQMQEAVLVDPEAVSRLMDMLSDPQEIVRNEVINHICTHVCIRSLNHSKMYVSMACFERADVPYMMFNM